MTGENKSSETQERVTPADYADQIDLVDLLKHVFKFWPLLILAAILGAGLMGGLKYVKTDYTYTSSSMLYVLSSTTSITNLADLEIGTQLSDDFVIMIKSKPVLDNSIKDVESELGITLTRDDILNALTVSHADDTRILTISCTTTDAELSKVLCDAITTRSAQRMSEVTQTDSPTVVESAEVASEPNGRGIVNQGEKGALAGIVIMFIILCIPYLTNDKLRKSDDVEKFLGEVVLGVVPYERSLVSTARVRRKSKK